MLLLVISITSCKDDDNDVQTTIVGVWQPTSVKISGTYNGQSFSETITANECQLKSRSTFRSDGTGNSVIWNDDSGTCTQQADQNFTYTYDANTKIISITSNGSTTSGTVSTLSDTKLVYQQVATYDYNGQNVPATMEIFANRIN